MGVFTRSSKLPTNVMLDVAGSLLDICWIV